MPDQQEPPTPPGNSGNGQLPLPGGEVPNRNVPVNIEDEMKRSYLAYAMSVIVGRALPDIRDGLKPVHRRILFGMSEMGLTFNRPTRKCAKIVGEVLGKFHPHGDGAVYAALVRLAQPFSMRYPLIDGQGNYGSVDGDPPAAMRYTEARLARISAALLEDIDKETVDMKENYDGNEEEPEVLPTRVPNLLINGSSGIAVGMATNIPPHNLTEVINACIAVTENPDIHISEILKLMPGPDFPTGGYILGRSGILDYYTRGRGSLKLRAKVSTEPLGKDREAIIVHQIPYQVNKALLIEQIASLVNEKRIEGISDVRDESDRDGMRMVFELKRGEQSEIILNNLYKLTQMQISFGVIMLSIVNGAPVELGVIDIIKRFLEHRVDVVRRRTDYLLRKAREREHLLLGFQRALNMLDAIIAVIRAARNPREARDFLTAVAAIPEDLIARLPEINFALAWDFSERQAQAIIELQLQRLTGMEQQKIIDELADIQRQIAGYLEILGSETVLREVIVKELKEIQATFGDARVTEIIEDTGEIRLEDLVQVEDVAVTVTRGGYIKRTSIDTYRRQIRGGKGRIGMGTRNEDVVEHLVVASTHSYLMIFTSKGRVYWLKIYEIPDAATTGKGKNISGLINLQPDETVKAFFHVKEFVPDTFIVMVTKHGVIKKTELTDFANVQSRGIIALSVDDGDELLAAKLTKGDNFIFLASREGKAIRFAESQVRAMGRPARGVRAMDLDEGDYLIGMEVVGSECMILSISENGYGKRTGINEYRLTARGGKGIINMKTTARIGNVVQILSVDESTEVMLITKDGKVIRIESNFIRQAGRSTQGVRLVRMEEGDQVAAAGVIPESDAVIIDNGDQLPLQ